MELATQTATTGSNFQQAYAASVAETSAPAEQSPPVAASPETSPASPLNEPPAPASESLDAATPTDDLISETELTALKAKHANDPDALIKELKGQWTRKNQAASEAIAFAKDFHANPTAAISKLAPSLGLTVTPTATERQTAATTKTAQTIADAATSKLTELLGAELGAEFGTVLRAVAEETAKSVVAPIQTAHQELQQHAAHEQQAAMFSAFEARHPDWKLHEAKIVELGQMFEPKAGSDLGKYMDKLYDLATVDTRIATGVQTKIDQMTQGAKTAESATRTVPDSAIQQAPRKIRNVRDAYEEAKAEARGGAR